MFTKDKIKAAFELQEKEEQTESRLVYEIMQEIGKHGAVFRTNSGYVRLPNGKFFKGLPEGFADIMLIRRDGVVCFIECKVKPNKATDKQEAFIEKMRRMNCRAGVAYSVEEALEICGLIGVSKAERGD